MRGFVTQDGAARQWWMSGRSSPRHFGALRNEANQHLDAKVDLPTPGTPLMPRRKELRK
jgi:hypothetical protein